MSKSCTSTLQLCQSVRNILRKGKAGGDKMNFPDLETAPVTQQECKLCMSTCGYVCVILMNTHKDSRS